MITVPDYPYWTTVPTIAVICVGVVFLALAVLAMFSVLFDWAPALTALSIVVAIVVAFFGSVIIANETENSQNKKVHTYKVQELQQMGYTEVDLTGKEFVASKDGEYVRGYLVPFGERTFEVYEGKKVE